MSDDDAHQTMLAMIFQTRVLAQVLRCAAEFSLADHLRERPRSADSIAAAAGLNAHATHRLLRYFATVGLAKTHVDGTYEATPLLATLGRDDPWALRSFAIAQNGPGQWAVLSKLDEAVRTGLPQAEPALGCNLYEYYSRPENSAEAQAYRQGLAGLNTITEMQVVKLFDGESPKRALDVGGSLGSMVMALMEAHPAMQGTVLDLPAVAEQAYAEARARGLSDRFSFVAGDFFENVPASDLYILKHVLGNWPDQECCTILRNCFQAAGSGGRVLILENMIEDVPSHWSVNIDIVTMAAVGGRVRSSRDYQRFLADAGFEVEAFHRVSPLVSMLQAIRH